MDEARDELHSVLDDPEMTGEWSIAEKIYYRQRFCCWSITECSRPDTHTGLGTSMT